MSDMRRWFWSGWARAAMSGAVMGLVLLMSGDRAKAAISIGIDPLEVLKLQVRPNVLLVLDSSGSMREDLTSSAPSPAVGPNDLGDMHPRAKMSQAKDTLLTFIQNNQTAVSFQFGRYNQPAGTTSLANSGNNRFLYASEAAAAAGIQINPGGNGTSTGRLKRDACAAVPTTPGAVCGDTQIDLDGTAVNKLFAGRFFNGQVVRYLANGTYCSTTPAAPVNSAANNPAWVDLQLVTGTCAAPTDSGSATRFTFFGNEGDWGNPSSACDGFFSLVNLQPCANLDQLSLISPFLQPSLSINSDGSIAGYTETAGFGINSEPTFNGIRAGGFTPIANTIIDIKTYFNDYYNGGPLLPAGLTAIKNQNPKQRTFMIFVTDGDDTCLSDGTADTSDDGTAGTGNNANKRALRAAYEAEQLYKRIVATDPASGVPTFLMLFGSGAAKSRGDWTAYGGSGMSITPTAGVTGYDKRWSTIPTQAQINACTTCKPAFAATTAQELADALQSVINQVVGQGEFSASPEVVGTVFELVVDQNPLDTIVESPLNPSTRYNQRINILYQSTFDLPKWEGRLFAFRNDGSFQAVNATTNSLGIWEAGQTLFEKVTGVLQATDKGHGADEFTFAELHGGATPRNMGAALIQRRIFTSNGNGTFTRAAAGTSLADPQFDASAATGSNVVALWPPDQTGLTSGIGNIDPAVGTAGPLDAALGISTLTYLQLQAQFGSCLASTDAGFGAAPAGCDVVANPTLALNTAMKEAREAMLAWIAGAQVDKGTDGKPVRLVGGAQLFSSRGWLLMDNENSAVAIASPPLQFAPTEHGSEFVLYRDGRRDANGQGIDELKYGFGLRNPDFDDPNPQANLTLKPTMTVVFSGGNDMVHAFRAGPQCVGGNCASGEQGSQELWGYVPFDQLAKIQDLMAGQVTTPHTYMIASSIRLATVFVPDADGYQVNGATFGGRWRTVMMFGRGPGGKYYTMLDVTSPGAFTTSAIATNPPWVMWSRGNPDTIDGTVGGTATHNATDTSLYADMGQSWAVPAIGNVQLAAAPVPAPLVCPVSNVQTEWRVFVGSGYGDTAVNANEGKRFYQLDALTGNVCQSSLLLNGTTTYIDDNALVAGPSGFNPKAQDAPGSIVRDTQDFVTRIYQPDVHGRIWRFSSASGGLLYDAGPTQPFGNSVALLKINSIPSVFAEAGNDNRVPDGAGPFKMFGVKDTVNELVYTPTPFGTLIPGFPLNFDVGSGTRIRGTVQPLVFFNDNASGGQARIFFAGTRFNPPGVGGCVSTFDTILFAVSGNNAGAVYDFTGDGVADLYTVIAGNKTTGVISGGGSVIVGDSGALSSAPTPTPNPNPTPIPPPPVPPQILTSNMRTNSPVCRVP